MKIQEIILFNHMNERGMERKDYETDPLVSPVQTAGTELHIFHTCLRNHFKNHSYTRSVVNRKGKIN
jgi:hypothetical protein